MGDILQPGGGFHEVPLVHRGRFPATTTAGLDLDRCHLRGDMVGRGRGNRFEHLDGAGLTALREIHPRQAKGRADVGVIGSPHELVEAGGTEVVAVGLGTDGQREFWRDLAGKLVVDGVEGDLSDPGPVARQLDQAAIPVDAPVVRVPGLDGEVLRGLQLAVRLGELTEFDPGSHDAQPHLDRLSWGTRERGDGGMRVQRRGRREHTRPGVVGVDLWHR